MLITNKKFAPATRPTVYYAKNNFTLEFEFATGVLEDGKTYHLAIDSDLNGATPPMLETSATPTGDKLTFECSSFNSRFASESRVRTIATAQIYEGESETVILDDQIGIRGRTDIDGVPPEPFDEYMTATETMEAIASAETEFLAKSNTFSGTITVQRDSSSLLTVINTSATGRSGIDYIGTGRSYWSGVGNATDTIEALRNCWGVYDLTAAAPRLTINPAGLLWAADISINGIASLVAKLAEIDAALASGGEGSSFYPPVANYLVNDATYGAVYYLDSTIPSIVFPERVLGLKKVRLRLVSANPAVTGNIVIVPAVDGVDQSPFTLAVGAVPATIDLEFSAAVTGRFSLRRDYAAAADTLDNVTAIVTALRILEV